MKMLLIVLAMLIATPALAHDPGQKAPPKIHYQPEKIEKKSKTGLWIALAAVAVVAIVMAQDDDDCKIVVQAPEPKKDCKRD
jgi:hypothetical protein